VKNYRQLNEIKKDMLIEFKYPTEFVSLVPVIFYNESYTKDVNTKIVYAH